MRTDADLPAIRYAGDPEGRVEGGQDRLHGKDRAQRSADAETRRRDAQTIHLRLMLTRLAANRPAQKTAKINKSSPNGIRLPPWTAPWRTSAP